MGENRGRVLLVDHNNMNIDLLQKKDIAKTQPQIFCPTCCAGHAPFLFYLMDLIKPEKVVSLGVWYGFSHFVFCQASSFLQSGTECHAVDSWEGDKNMGRFNSGIFDYFMEKTNQFFPEQAVHIHKKKFSEALPGFLDGSIDILFIDGAHNYKDVHDDFHSWLPKISSKSIVLMHDTNVSGKEFGVSEFYLEVSQKYPSFNFEHNHGLGVLLTGEERNETLLEFSKMNAFTFKSVHDFFANLGRPLELEVECSSLKKQLSTALHQNKAMRESISWRLTSPLRLLKNSLIR